MPFVFWGKCLSIKFAARPLIAFVFATSLSFPSAAQQTPPPSNPAPPASGTETSGQPATPGQQNSPEAQGQGAPATSPQSPSDKDKDRNGQSTSSQGKSTGTSNDRLFFTLPNFLTLENAGQVPPLTPGKKFKVVLRGSFDYVEYAWYAAVSGIGQAENSEPAYRQGAEGYGKRYATNFADGTIENFMVGAVFPSILHQDPRFFQSSEGGFCRRADYAVSRIFVTRSDSGRVVESVEHLLRRYNPGAPIFHARIRPEAWVDAGTGESIAATALPYSRVAAFCGLGNPESFWYTLSTLGLNVVDRLHFDDHHAYKPWELRFLSHQFRQAGAEAILTTEKDMYNLCKDCHRQFAPLPLCWLRIGMQVDREDEFLSAIDRGIRSSR